MGNFTNPAFEYDEDATWRELRSWLTFQVRGRVSSSHVPDWRGQEEALSGNQPENSLMLIARHDRQSLEYPVVPRWRRVRRYLRFCLRT